MRLALPFSAPLKERENTMNEKQMYEMQIFLYMLQEYIVLANSGCIESRETLIKFTERCGGENSFLSHEWREVYEQVEQTIRDTSKFLV